MKTYKGALIGCGYASWFQLTAWGNIEGVEIVAVSSRNREAAENRAAEFNIANVYTDYLEMLDNEEIDFVDIATPPVVHLEMIKEAARRGFHVLCQKPISETMGELRQMIEICDAAGVAFTVNENGRFQPWFQKMKSLIEAGAIGTPFYANLSTRWRGSFDDPQFGQQPFFAKMPRLVIYEIGVHYLDTLRFLFGEANSLYAQKAQINPEISGEELAVVTVNMDELIAVLDLSWASVPARKYEESVSWGDARVEGNAGTIALWTDGTMVLRTPDGDETFSFPDDSEVIGYQGAQQHFVDSLRAGHEAEISGRQMLKTMELVFAAYYAAQTNTVYEVTQHLDHLR